MKKKIIILFTLVCLPLLAGAQAEIKTKKIKFEDFTSKVTKIVLTGNEFYDSSLRDEITSLWRISPYEFCTLDEFEALKTSPDYYFLLTVKGQFKKEKSPGLDFISLVKGDKKATKGIRHMLEVVSIPICSSKYPSGREHVFMHAIITIIQDHASNAMDRDYDAYFGPRNKRLNLSETGDMDLYFAVEDLSKTITEDEISLFEEEGVLFVEEDEIDDLISSNTPNTLVSYVVSPYKAENGSYCYKMIIDCQTKQLYFYKKKRLSKYSSVGFFSSELKYIIDQRKNKK